MDDAVETFICAAEAAGVRVTDDQMRRLDRAARWLARASGASGLSQYETPDEALLRAMGPALAYFNADYTPRRGCVADLGCGNGAIGATIALFAPELEVHLVDRAQRAYTTSELLTAKLGLSNARAVYSPIDRLDRSYDVAVFRALAPAEAALPLAISVVRVGGCICAFHRAGDGAFEHPGDALQLLGTIDTLVPDLMLTCYRR